MTAALNGLGVIMPKTIEGFRALVDQAAALGDTTQVARLIGLSSSFAAMLEAQAGQAANLASFVDGLNKTASDNLAAATTDLRASFSFEMDKTRESFAASIAALQDELTGARDRLANSRSIADALTGALQKRVFPSIAAQRQSQDAAAGYLRSLLGLTRINDVDALNAALDAVASPSTDTYASLEDYRRDFAKTSGVIAALEKTAGITLSADEKAVLVLEQQVEAMQAQSDAALKMMQDQLDALLGISDGIKSLSEARAAFTAASSAATGTPTTNFAKSLDVNGFADNFSREQWYLANNPDVLQAVAQGGFSSGADHYQQFGQFEGRSFAGGGYTGSGSRSGGLDGRGGFMAMMHPQETVIDHTRSKASGGSGMVDELRKLNEQVERLTAYNRQTTINTGNSEFNLKDIARNGVQVTPAADAVFATREVA
jgi:hypothetical protein